MDFLSHISSDPDICHGKACIKGTRVLVSVLLDSLAEGMSVADLLRNFPAITEDDVQAALAYAAALSREEILEPVAVC
jgi:uncharacterized protein (DUF433 family)